MKTIKFIFTGALIILSTTLFAQIPQVISFQGVLNDANGDAVTDGNYTLEFELFDALTGGTSMWGAESHLVTTVNGLYSVQLGSNGSAFDNAIDFSAAYFLQVKVGTETLSPRIELSVSPYAFVARSVLGSANAFPSSGNVGIGTLTPSTELEVSGTVTATNFAGGGSGLTGLNATNLAGGTVSNTLLDTDLQDLADGSLTGTKVGLGINATNINTGSLALANGGTGSTTAGGARTNLGLIIGTNVQAFDADLTDLADGSLTGSKVGTGISGTNITTGSIQNSVLDADLQDLADGSLTGSKVGTGISATNITSGTLPDARLESTVDVTRLNTTGGVHVGGTTDPGTDNLDVDGFTTLGDVSAPAIKMKKITGTTGAAEGDDIAITHGLTLSKIISVSVIVEASASLHIHPGFTNSVEHNYNWYLTSTAIRIWNSPSQSGSILSKPVKILITYEQ